MLRDAQWPALPCSFGRSRHPSNTAALKTFPSSKQFYASCRPYRSYANTHPRHGSVHPFALHLESNWSKHDGTFVQEDIMRKELRALLITALLCAPVFGLTNYAAAGARDEKKQ